MRTRRSRRLALRAYPPSASPSALGLSFSRSAPDRSAPRRFASDRSTPDRSTPDSPAPDRSAPLSHSTTAPSAATTSIPNNDKGESGSSKSDAGTTIGVVVVLLVLTAAAFAYYRLKILPPLIRGSSINENYGVIGHDTSRASLERAAAATSVNLVPNAIYDDGGYLAVQGGGSFAVPFEGGADAAL